jgi:hypothetical protein
MTDPTELRDALRSLPAHGPCDYLTALLSDILARLDAIEAASTNSTPEAQ